MTDFLDKLRQLVLNYSKNYPVKIYLFGSRANQTARRRSDVDIAILPLENLPRSYMIGLRECIDESSIPYTVDLINLAEVDEDFKEKIVKEAIKWKD